VAGELVSVLSSQVTVDGQRAAGGDSLNAGAVLSTDTTGAATFRLREMPSDCQIQPNSALRLLQPPGPLLEFQRGESVCSTGAGQGSLEVTAGGTRARLRGVVTMDVDNGEMRVIDGEAQAESPGGQVGPRVPEGQAVQLARPLNPPRPYDRNRLDPMERAAAERFGASLPGPTTTSTTRRTTTTTRPGTTTSTTARPTTTRGGSG
jgi:hypothetical protein